ncbi:MAG: UMP kinase [Nanobdellota archaeon]
MVANIVFSLGGSLIIPEGVISTKFLMDFKELIKNVVKQGNRAIIVTGGGSICRMYNDAAEKMAEPSETDLDLMGIAATKLNAELLRILFGEMSHKSIIKDPTQEFMLEKEVVMASGYKPGNSSDKVAVMLAKKFNSDYVINMTNIDMVYDADPKVNNEAKPIKEIAWNDFLSITGDKWSPGKNVPFDPVASKLARDNNINVAILNGNNLENISKFLNGQEFVGTLIKG